MINKMGKKYFVFEWRDFSFNISARSKAARGYEIIKAEDAEHAKAACDRVVRPIHGHVRPYLNANGYGSREDAKAKLNPYAPVRIWDAGYDEVVSGAGIDRDISLVRMGDKWNSIEDETGCEGPMWYDAHGAYTDKWGLYGKAHGKIRAIVRNGGKFALVDDEDKVIGGWHDDLERVFVDNRTQEVKDRAAKREKMSLEDLFRQPQSFEQIMQEGEENEYGYLARITDGDKVRFMNAYGDIVDVKAGTAKIAD